MLIVPVYVLIITRQAIMLQVFDSLNTKCECTVKHGKISLASDTFTNLPPPTLNVDQLTQFFAKKGFTQEEMVTVSG